MLGMIFGWYWLIADFIRIETVFVRAVNCFFSLTSLISAVAVAAVFFSAINFVCATFINSTMLAGTHTFTTPRLYNEEEKKKQATTTDIM